MSDYQQYQSNHNFPQSTIDTGGTGTGLLWLFIAVAALGLLVLVGSLGGESSLSEGAPVAPAAEDGATEGASGVSATGTPTTLE